MALTVRRWFLLLGLLLAALGVALLPPGMQSVSPLTGVWARWWYSYQVPRRDPLEAEQQYLLRELAGAENERARVAYRDSLTRWVQPSSPAVHLILRGAVPAPIATRMRQVSDSLSGVLARLAPLPGRLALVVVGDTASAGAADDYNHLLLPAAGVPGLCALVMRARTLRRMAGVRWAEEELGTCVYYATFGPPGPEVERWLFRRGLDVAAAADWWEPAMPSRGDSLDVAWWRSGLLAVVFRREWRHFGSTGLIACRAGRTARCAPALLDFEGGPPRRVTPDRGVVLGAMEWWSFRTTGDGRGALRELVREFGPERFRRFWASPAPPEAAFAKTFGLPFAAWVERWARRTYGRTVVGPSLRWGGVAVWLLLSGAAIGLAVQVARRRQQG